MHVRNYKPMLIREYIYNSLKNIYLAEESRNIATIVCRDILGLSELDIYTGKYINLSEEKKRLLENSLVRLLNSEPIQYILEETEFYGLPFFVNKNVLIPRPETEELVELILKEHPHPTDLKILDIGTGSGAIAIALAKHMKNSSVAAWDISYKALDIAVMNAKANSVDIAFRMVDVLNEYPQTETFDIIVSNPPYIAEREKALMNRNVLEWEPATALFVPDNDPLLFYRNIAQLGKQILVPGGKLYFEINRSYGKETVELLKENGYRDVQLIQDMYGNDRIITAVL